MLTNLWRNNYCLKITITAKRKINIIPLSYTNAIGFRIQLFLEGWGGGGGEGAGHKRTPIFFKFVLHILCYWSGDKNEHFAFCHVHFTFFGRARWGKYI